MALQILFVYKNKGQPVHSYEGSSNVKVRLSDGERLDSQIDGWYDTTTGKIVDLNGRYIGQAPNPSGNQVPVGAIVSPGGSSTSSEITDAHDRADGNRGSNDTDNDNRGSNNDKGNLDNSTHHGGTANVGTAPVRDEPKLDNKLPPKSGAQTDGSNDSGGNDLPAGVTRGDSGASPEGPARIGLPGGDSTSPPPIQNNPGPVGAIDPTHPPGSFPEPRSGNSLDSWNGVDSKGRAYTVTIMENGAVVRQNEGESAYRMGYIDPDNYQEGSRDLSDILPGAGENGGKNPYLDGGGGVTVSSTPGWSEQVYEANPGPPSPPSSKPPMMPDGGDPAGLQDSDISVAQAGQVEHPYATGDDLKLNSGSMPTVYRGRDIDPSPPPEPVPSADSLANNTNSNRTTLASSPLLNELRSSAPDTSSSSVSNVDLVYSKKSVDPSPPPEQDMTNRVTLPVEPIRSPEDQVIEIPSGSPDDIARGGGRFLAQ